MEKKENKSVKKSANGGAGKKVVVNEGQIDLLLDMIKTADVTSEENQAENATLLELEGKRDLWWIIGLPFVHDILSWFLLPVGVVM